MSPKRIQLSRQKGYRKPEGAIVVARPSKWGNPFKAGRPDDGCREYAVQLFRNLLDRRPPTGMPTFPYPLDDEIRSELRGHDLCCWCPLGSPCHADVLLELANP